MSDQQHVAPPASGSSSGRAEAIGGDLINALLAAHDDYDGTQATRKAALRAKQALLDHIVHMHDVGFLSGRRSMQEEAAKAAEDAKAEFHGVDGWAAVAIKRIADAIRALNPETKP